MLSVVVPVYNEEQNLHLLYNHLYDVLSKLDCTFEIIFVDDGSTDGSLNIINELYDRGSRVKAISFTRNFGHEAAMIAGIDYSSGDAVICMDADLQHPPSKIKEMIDKFSEGYEIINMVRTGSKDASILKRITSRFFYYLLNKISQTKFEPNASDFFLISKRVADILRTEFRERARFLRGFIQIVGFKKTTINFIVPERAGGKSKYSLTKLFSLSINAMSTFSNLPLRLGIIAGLVFGLFSALVGIYSIIMKIMGNAPSGYTTIVVLISFLFAVQFFITGVIGEYIGFLFSESKKRPIYIVDKEINFEKHHDS